MLIYLAPVSQSQVAVCNLASIALNMYVTPERTFDFSKLAYVTKVIVRNLNKIIEINYYPVVEVMSSVQLSDTNNMISKTDDSTGYIFMWTNN